LLADGELVGIFPEGERSVLGDYQGALPPVADILARLPAPVVPVGLSGSYDSGPRWARHLRRRRVRVRVGPPIEWRQCPPARAVDTAIRSLLASDPAPVNLRGLRRERLGLVLWLCPRCGDERAWRPARLACDSCGARFLGTASGDFVDERGHVASLAELGRAVRRAGHPGALTARASAWVERQMTGPIRPLEPIGEGVVEVSAAAVRFGGLELPRHEIRSFSTEGADILQVATTQAMWQFHLLDGSAFRMHDALAASAHSRR